MNKIKWLFFLVFASSCQLGEKRKRLSEDHHQIAFSLIKKCDYPRALAHLLKGVKLDSQNFLVRHTLATVYFALEDYPLSIKHLKAILRQNSKITEARMTLARVYLELGQIDKAFKELKKVEKDQTYSDPLKIIALKGFAHFKKGEFLKAKKEFKEFLSVPKKEECLIVLHLGRIELILGRLDEAEKFFKKARQVCSNEKPICKEKNYDSHFFLASLYLQKNQKKKARYHLKIFLKASKESHPYRKKAQNLLKEAQ